MTLLLWILVIVVSNIGTFLLVRQRVQHDLTRTGLLAAFIGILEGGVKDFKFECQISERYYPRYQKLMQATHKHAKENGIRITAGEE